MFALNPDECTILSCDSEAEIYMVVMLSHVTSN